MIICIYIYWSSPLDHEPCKDTRLVLCILVSRTPSRGLESKNQGQGNAPQLLINLPAQRVRLVSRSPWRPQASTRSPRTPAPSPAAPAADATPCRPTLLSGRHGSRCWGTRQMPRDVPVHLSRLAKPGCSSVAEAPHVLTCGVHVGWCSSNVTTNSPFGTGRTHSNPSFRQVTHTQTAVELTDKAIEQKGGLAHGHLSAAAHRVGAAPHVGNQTPEFHA